MNNNEIILKELSNLNNNILTLLKNLNSYKEEEEEKHRIDKQWLDVHLQSINNNICYMNEPLRKIPSTNKN